MAKNKLSIYAELLTGNFSKSAKAMQTQLGQISAASKQVGRSLTRNVTAPIALLGAGMLKAAADMEYMETQMATLTGSAAEGKKVMKDLADFTAKTPFQLEGVQKAAKQLLATGTSVKDLQSQLLYLGDIAAAVGVPIEYMAAPLAKVQAQGKLTGETMQMFIDRSINLIPALAEVTGIAMEDMKQAISDGAISAETLNKALDLMNDEGWLAANGMLNLSKTLKGQLSTAMDNVKLAAAEFGKVLVPIAVKVTEKITALAQKFAEMDEGTKKVIVTAGAVLAAVGPLLYVFGQLAGAINAIKVLELGSTFAGIGRAALALAGPAAPLFMLLGAIYAVAKAFQHFSDDASDAQKMMRDVHTEAGKGEAKVNALVALYEKYEGQLDKQKQIMGDLKKLAPEYFGKLKAGETTVEELKDATEAYTASLVKQAFVKARQVEMDKKAANVAKKRLALIEKEAKRQGFLDAIAAGKMGAESNYREFKYQLSLLQREYDKAHADFQGFITETNELAEGFDLDAISSTAEDATGDAEDAFKSNFDGTILDPAVVKQQIKDSHAAAREALEAGDIDLADSFMGQAEEWQKHFDRMFAIWKTGVEDGDPVEIEITPIVDEDFGKEIKTTGHKIVEITIDEEEELDEDLNLPEIDIAKYEREKQAVIDANAELKASFKSLVGDTLATSAIGMADIIGQMAVGAKSVADLGNFALQSIGQFLSQMGAMMVKAAILASKFYANITTNPPAALAAGLALVAVGGALKAMSSPNGPSGSQNQQGVGGDFQYGNIPAFAAGGAVMGSTLALVGENPTSRGEAIIPFEKMGQFADMMGMNNNKNGATHVVVTGNLKGRDIELSGSRGGRQRRRRH